MSKQRRIVVFGKGGVGKSTFSANLSAHFALQGRKVLHVGCDPKADSTALLLEDPRSARTLLDILSASGMAARPQDVINKGRHGIDCIEVGGPEPGIGCGGRGIARALEYLEAEDVLVRGAYDIVLFDVLGDVVCGGFAAPLRKGFGDRVVIVASEDEMSFYAANNICKAVVRYSVNGVKLAGLVLNRRGPRGTRLDGEAFARLINARVLGYLPFSDVVEPARRLRLTAMEHAPGDGFSETVRQVAETVVNLDLDQVPLPMPLEQDAFYRFTAPDLAAAASARTDPVLSPASPVSRVPSADNAERSDGAADSPESDLPRDVVGGAASRKLLAEALGFASGPLAGRAEVTALRLTGQGDLHLDVRLDEDNHRVILRPPERGAFATTDKLGVAFSGERLTPRLQQVLRHTLKRIGHVPFERFARAVADDAEVPEVEPTAVRRYHRRSGPGPAQVVRERLVAAGADESLQVAYLEAKTDGGLEICLEPEPGHSLFVRLDPASRGGLVTTSEVALSYLGEQLDDEIRTMVAMVAAAVGETPLDHWSELVDGDGDAMDLGRPGAGSVSQQQAESPAWARFQAAEQFARNVFHLFRVDVPHVTIEHCDQECNYATPPIANNEYNFLNYPWLSPGPVREDPYAKGSEPGTYYTTQVTEMDVITGSTGKLERLLDKVVDGLSSERFIMLNNTCVPVVAGDDVDSLVKGLRTRCPVPVMAMGSHLGDNPFLTFFEQLRGSHGFAEPPRVPHAVNLVGFPAGPGSDELVHLLDQAGVVLNDRPFPTIEPSIFDTFLAAGVHVYYPNGHYEELYRRLFAELPGTALTPTTPYGMSGTSGWLAAVADAAGRGEEMAALCSAQPAYYEPILKPLLARIRGARVGLVLDASGWEMLATPERAFGIPFWGLLAELGLGVELLLPDEELGGGEELAAEVRSGLPEALSVALSFFDSPDRLRQLMRRSEAAAFYTDFASDHRVAGAGQMAFSLQFFEPGFAGFVRTARRFVRVFETPFFARYGAYTRGGDNG